MKIAMFTNTYTPHIGGVARSVSGLAEGLRDLGHSVLIVAPEFPHMPQDETGVVRMPAIQQFAGSDFSAPAPVSLALSRELENFKPDIIHTHHPFLLGDTALRVSASRNLPVVFTYHTRYELYGHYVAQDSPALQRLVLSLALGYCELCDGVIAPSESIAAFLEKHEVEVPITVIPTGIEASAFTGGNGIRLRSELAIAPDVFVAGHVGRLAREKNLAYLTDAVRLFLRDHDKAHFIVAGTGDMSDDMKTAFSAAGLAGRVHMLGSVEGERLADAYAAMNVFAFSSHSETQGLVLAEAMTAGIPVVALDAPGAREIVRDGRNGRLLSAEAPAAHLAEALGWIAGRSPQQREALRTAARQMAATYSRAESISRTVSLYAGLLEEHRKEKPTADSMWETARRALGKEWDILRNVANAVGNAVIPSLDDRTGDEIEGPARSKDAAGNVPLVSK